MSNFWLILTRKYCENSATCAAGRQTYVSFKAEYSWKQAQSRDIKMRKQGICIPIKLSGHEMVLITFKSRQNRWPGPDL